MAKTSPQSWQVPALAAALSVISFVWLQERRKRQAAEQEILEERQAAARHAKLRDEERKGRIRAEQQLREGLSSADGPAASLSASSRSEGFVFHPIGTFQSCYRQRCGTPRQGGLVTGSLATLRCVRDLNPNAALEGFSEFSHCWVLYVFHENTNLSREGRTVARRNKQQKGRVPLWQGLCMKVAPPRCPELRVGVLSCRTPHRPNPIGLSLAKIVRVDASKGEVVLAGLDVVDGTPCLDLKPYMPNFESLPSATVPTWVQASYDEPMMKVFWASEAAETFHSLVAVQNSGKRPLDIKPFSSEEELRLAIEDTLALDIRSPLQRERHPNPGVAAGKGSEKQSFFTGDLWFHEFHITYSLLPEVEQPGMPPASVRIDKIEAGKKMATTS
eukprot:TRINITY_DN26976_c0_g1_i1.p1 TRINITY_DN26976_c0_g1~~TRINITY_DN26976_c0_g1_i1.p1  ORF type:complete len:388 (-),score=74.96 TRINITY_DN26976_c0_g1_i1:151-1314(-)